MNAHDWDESVLFKRISGFVAYHYKLLWLTGEWV